MAGIIQVDIWTDSRGDAVTVEPVRCPDTMALGPACWTHNAVHGTRECVYAHWFGSSETTRRTPTSIGAEMRQAARCHGQGVVFCALARRNKTGGCYPRRLAPVTTSQEDADV